MHELSIANSIINIVLKQVSNNQPPVKKIGLKIGALSGIMPDALQFGFDALKKETALNNAELDIEEVAVIGQCNSCKATFNVHNYSFNCPECQSSSVTMQEGDELDIAWLELEEET